MVRTVSLGLGVSIVAVTASGCGGAAAEEARRAELPEQAQALQGGTNMDNRCSSDGPGFEISEYDTSGDEYPDVRKVFLRVGEPPLQNLILVCRESDLNADGTRDVVRYYTDEGRPLREESDRDFDGRMDQIIFFEGGRISRMERDTVGNGMVDEKIFYEGGRPLRSERDMAARSTSSEWKPDRWEYYEEGRMVRMGVDLDGDGRVDRWDRDAEWRAEQQAEEERQAAQASDAEEGEGEGEDSEASQGGA